MTSAKRTSGRLFSMRSVFVSQGLPYIAIGGVQLVVDWLCFVLLTWLGVPVVTSNLAGRGVGAIFGFTLNGRYTFAQKDIKPVLGLQQMLRFVVAWMVMAALSTVAVAQLAHSSWLWVAWLGKPFIDGALAVLGFLLSRYWIFK